MGDFKMYENKNMKVACEYPASWILRHIASNPAPDFDDVSILSPRIDGDVDKGAAIGISIYPELDPHVPLSPDEQELQDEIKRTMKETPCKLGEQDAVCLEGANQLGAKIVHHIIKKNGTRFMVSFVVSPGSLWQNYQGDFDRFLRTFRFTKT